MGLGLHSGGVGVAKFFCRQGAKVLVTDIRTRKQLRESVQKLRGLPIKYVFGCHRAEDFIKTDLVIKNPGVPADSLYLKIARKHKVAIETDVSIFFDLCKAPIIGITGTKGKSTVATLVYLFLKKKYPKTILAGNIGVSPLEVLSKITKKSKVVLELSSFGLEDLKKSPHIAVITTLFPDHLNRYKNFRDYINAKKSIFKYQEKNDILILNYDNPETKKLALSASSKVYFFSKKKPIFGIKDPNLLATLSVAKFFKISKKDIKKVLSNFKGIPNRQELVAIKRGVKYVNDTAATTPQSVILAVRTFKKRFPKSEIILIAGGVDKKLSYKNLAKEIKNNIKELILLPGSATDKIKKRLKEVSDARPLSADRGRASVYLVKSMEEAVKKAFSKAVKGDVVLLSPGAASFNLFKNEFDRGKQFNNEVKKL